MAMLEFLEMIAFGLHPCGRSLAGGAAVAPVRGVRMVCWGFCDDPDQLLRVGLHHHHDRQHADPDRGARHRLGHAVLWVAVGRDRDSGGLDAHGAVHQEHERAGQSERGRGRGAARGDNPPGCGALGPRDVRLGTTDYFDD